MSELNGQSGRLIGDTLFSPANRRRFEHWVWVPHGDGPFPLLVLLHGVYDAGGFVWWFKGEAHRTLDTLVGSGEIPPLAVVMAGDTGAEQGSGYCDWADGTTAAETYLMRELLPALEASLPLSGVRHIAGLSMGGYGALLLALRHPGSFDSASATSGFFRPERMFKFVDEAADRMWGDDAGRDAHDVTQLICDPRRRAGLRIAFDCGTDDELIDQNRELHVLLEKEGAPHGYAEHPGGHEWEYWGAHLPDHLRFHTKRGGPLQP